VPSSPPSALSPAPLLGVILSKPIPTTSSNWSPGHSTSMPPCPVSPLRCFELLGSEPWVKSEGNFLAQETMEEIWGIKNLRIENPLRKGRIYKYSMSLSLCASHTSRVQISNPKFDVRKCELLSIQIWIALKWGRNTSRLCHHAQGIGFTCCISIRGCLSANLTAVEVVPPR